MSIKKSSLREKIISRPNLSKGLSIFSLFTIIIASIGILMSFVVTYMDNDNSQTILSSTYNSEDYGGVKHSFNVNWIKWPLYFTIQSNILVVIVLTLSRFKIWNIKSDKASGFINLVVINITITMIIFWAILFPTFESYSSLNEIGKWNRGITFILHLVVPLLMIFFFIWFTLKRDHSFRSLSFFNLWKSTLYYLFWFLLALIFYYVLANTGVPVLTGSKGNTIYTDNIPIYSFLNFEKKPLSSSLVTISLIFTLIMLNIFLIFVNRFVTKKSLTKNKTFAIGGQTASGKSTALKNLNNSLGIKITKEFDPNDPKVKKILKEINSGKVKNGLENQLSILDIREITYLKYIKQNSELIFDRTFIEDFIFSKVYISKKSLQKEYFEIWNEKVSKILAENGKPQFYIFLDLNWKTFKERLFQRGRENEIGPFEKNKKHWKKLLKKYKLYFLPILKSFGIKTYKISTNKLNPKQVEEKIINILKIEKYKIN
ncbi:MAG: deoxynucleoside kinase [Mollicutes bacterium PWAP]|nr:deoxynucleoside kinase [Mollicutes bacterium PWAP]